MDRQMERRTGRSRKEGEQQWGVWEDRDGATKVVFLRSRKGRLPLLPHSCLSVFHLPLCVRQAECGQISTGRCSSKEGGKGHKRSLRQRGSALPTPERRGRKLGGREVFRASRQPGPGFRGEPRWQPQRGPRSSLPRDFVPVAAGWVPCNISRSALTGSRGEGNRASLAHLAFPPTPGGA